MCQLLGSSPQRPRLKLLTLLWTQPAPLKRVALLLPHPRPPKPQQPPRTRDDVHPVAVGPHARAIGDELRGHHELGQGVPAGRDVQRGVSSQRGPNYDGSYGNYCE